MPPGSDAAAEPVHQLPAHSRLLLFRPSGFGPHAHRNETAAGWSITWNRLAEYTEMIDGTLTLTVQQKPGA